MRWSKAQYHCVEEGRHDLDNLAGTEVYVALLCKTGKIEDELTRIDALTPIFRSRIENGLSIQQRRIVDAIAKAAKPLKIKEIAEILRMQQNIVSAQVHEILKKGGYIEKVGKEYRLDGRENPDFEKFYIMRYTEFQEIWRSEGSEELIPDRKNPISYFMKHRKETIEKFLQRNE